MNRQSIAELNQLFAERQLTDSDIESLQFDERKGVQAIIKKYRKQQEKEQRLKEQFIKMTSYEQTCRKNGFHLMAGVDEAGRGPLAGPVVAAAVILPENFTLYGLNDSKQLTAQERKAFYDMIVDEAVAFHVAVIEHTTIDEINIFEATKLAMKQALEQLNPQPDCALIDAVTLNGLNFPVKSLVKGDQKSITIAAASILAKVTRDELMNEIHKVYPQYDFKSNAGYGTKYHIEQLKEWGPSPYHRQSFAPVKASIK